MEPTRIVAIRHGETDWNASGRVQGHIDIPLNATGRRQAERLAEALAGESLAAIYASDLHRAHATAAAVAALAGLPVVSEPGLRERCFGHFEGLSFAEVEARWPEQSLRWRRRDPAFGPEGGETLADFYARSIATTTRLAAAHAGQAIAVVAHGGVLDCLYRAASRIDLQAPRTWKVGNATINRLLFTGEGFTLVGWSDDGHLEAGALDEDRHLAPAPEPR